MKVGDFPLTCCSLPSRQSGLVLSCPGCLQIDQMKQQNLNNMIMDGKVPLRKGDIAPVHP